MTGRCDIRRVSWLRSRMTMVTGGQLEKTTSRRLRRSCAIGAVALFAGTASAGADYAREERWAEQIVPGIVVGDPIYLSTPSRPRVLALYTEVANAKGGAIVVHGVGVHPDWGLIGGLRTGLADAGFATLSVQMPVLEANALGEGYRELFPDAAERLQAAVAFLNAKGHRKIAIASHSMGARMTNFFLAGAPGNGIGAWIAIGISSGEFAEAAKLRVPVLDIYGERDLPQVLKNANARAAVLKTLKGSAQVEVAGADHYFAGSEAELVKQAKLFLDQRLK